MAKWHTIEALRAGGDGHDHAFAKQGPLVSLGREPPQNSTDNPLHDDYSEPVIVRYSIRRVNDIKKLKQYLPQNPWIDHVTTHQNSAIIEENDLPNKIESGIDVLLIEDYNATGLIGDANQVIPELKSIHGDEYDQDSIDNNYLWFMRAVHEAKPKGGRGGSWGLGKLAIPLSSKVRTFFCVTTQENTGKRYLAGQAHLKPHYRFRQRYESTMYYAENEVSKSGNPHSWVPISDAAKIDEFCELFGADRKSTTSGTSLVIPIPRDDVSNLEDIAVCVLANYAVPILKGQLELHISKCAGKLSKIDAGNIKKIIEADKIPWGSQPEKRNGKPNPAWSNKERMLELIALYEAEMVPEGDRVNLQLGQTIPGRAATSQYAEIIPDQDNDVYISARDAFHENKFIHVCGKIAVNKSDGTHSFGEYKLTLRKCLNEDAAEAHYYRDQISLPLVNNRDPVVSGISSLIRVEEGGGNPLAEMLRQSEGPAHLLWDTQEPRLTNYYELGPSTIYFLRDIAKKLVSQFNATESNAEAIWADLFNLGTAGEGKRRGGGGEPVDVERNLRISEDVPGGFSVNPRAGCEDLTGNEYIIRVGYPKTGDKELKKAPDPRHINVHAMTWNGNKNAEIHKDVKAENGDICVDRVRVKILKPIFRIELSGLDDRLKAQAIAHKIGNTGEEE